jgi:TonB family protein
MQSVIVFTLFLFQTLLVSGQTGYFLQSDTLVPNSLATSDSTSTHDASFPGGEHEFFMFIHKNLVYPEIDKEMHIEGTVYVQFIVNTDGSVTEITIVKGVSPTIDAEVIRVMKRMPLWVPANADGTLMRTRMTIPVKFQIN